MVGTDAIALAHAVEANPLLQFRPGPKQRRFVESDARRLMMRSGNRAGKTASAAVKTWRYVLDNPGSTVLVVCADHTSKVEVVGLEMHKWAPRSQLVDSDYNPTRGWKNSVIQVANGSKVIFRSAESNSTSIAGIEADAVWIDEVPPRSLWGEILSRVATTEGPVWLTLTPIGRPVQWLREIVEAEDSPWVQIVPSLTVEDCPWRTQSSIDAQIESYGAWEYAQRVHGAWEGETVSRVFESFDPQINVDEDLPFTEWITGIGMDHGELVGREVALLVVLSTDLERLWVIDEYVSERATDVADDAAQIEAMLGRRGLKTIHVDRAFGDVNSAGKGAIGRVSVNRLLETELGVTIRRPNKRPGSVEYGCRLIDLALGRGHLRIHPRCGNTITCLSHWQGANDDLKHLIDALRYVAVPLLEDLYDPQTIDRIRLTRA